MWWGSHSRRSDIELVRIGLGVGDQFCKGRKQQVGPDETAERQPHSTFHSTCFRTSCNLRVGHFAGHHCLLTTVDSLRSVCTRRCRRICRTRRETATGVSPSSPKVGAVCWNSACTVRAGAGQQWPSLPHFILSLAGLHVKQTWGFGSGQRRPLSRLPLPFALLVSS